MVTAKRRFIGTDGPIEIMDKKVNVDGTVTLEPDLLMPAGGIEKMLANSHKAQANMALAAAQKASKNVVGIVLETYKVDEKAVNAEAERNSEPYMIGKGSNPHVIGDMAGQGSWNFLARDNPFANKLAVWATPVYKDGTDIEAENQPVNEALDKFFSVRDPITESQVKQHVEQYQPKGADPEHTELDYITEPAKQKDRQEKLKVQSGIMMNSDGVLQTAKGHLTPDGPASKLDLTVPYDLHQTKQNEQAKQRLENDITKANQADPNVKGAIIVLERTDPGSLTRPMIVGTLDIGKVPDHQIWDEQSKPYVYLVTTDGAQPREDSEKLMKERFNILGTLDDHGIASKLLDLKTKHSDQEIELIRPQPS